MADSMPTVTEAFRAAGYAAGAFVGNAFYAGRLTGFDRGFLRFDDYPVSWGQLWWSANLSQVDASRRVVDAAQSGQWSSLPRALRRSTLCIVGANHGDRHDASTLVERSFAWRDGLNRRPVFAMIDFFDAHSLYETPLGTRFGGRRAIDQYDGAIASADSMVGTSLASRWSATGVRTSSPALAEAEQPYNQRNRWPTSCGPMKALVTDDFHYIRRGDSREWVDRWRGDTTGRGDVTATDSGAAALDESHARLRQALGARWTERGVS